MTTTRYVRELINVARDLRFSGDQSSSRDRALRGVVAETDQQLNLVRRLHVLAKEDSVLLSQSQSGAGLDVVELAARFEDPVCQIVLQPPGSEIAQHREEDGRGRQALLPVDDVVLRALPTYEYQRAEEVRVIAVSTLEALLEVLEKLKRLLLAPPIRPLIVRDLELEVARKDPSERLLVRLDLVLHLRLPRAFR